MNKIKYTPFFYFFFISFLLGNSFEKYQWGKIESGLNNQLVFVGGNSKNNFWVQNNFGKLLHIKNNQIEVFTPPSRIKYISTSYYRIADNDFFCAVVTPNWQGEIYRVTNNIWKKYNIKTLAPIKYFYKTNNGNLYLLGDFGLILILKKNRWKIIPSPFKSHITSAVTKNNKLYITTRNNGLVEYDGKKFSFLTSKGNYKSLKSVKIINHFLYALSINDKVIKYIDSKGYEISDSEILKCFQTKPSSKFGFAERNISHNKRITKLIFPQNFNVFSLFGSRENIIMLKDKTILLFSNDGNIFLSKKTNENYFTNLAQTYRIDDLPNSYNSGTQFLDLNNDGMEDLLILNSNFGNYLSLYQGVQNSAFANITSLLNLPDKKNKILFFTISDFNKDNLKDIIFELQEKSVHKLSLYQNLGNFKFKNINKITLPNDFQTMGIRNLSTYDYDKDGDEDIIVTSYYEKGDDPGYILIYKNNRWGNFIQSDTTFKKFTTGWNEKLIFADITNNDTLDIFNVIQWRKDHLLLGNNNKFIDASSSHFPDQGMTETTNALLFDFENDGDLDIFTSGKNDFIRVYVNNGKGKFSENTYNLFSHNFLEEKKFKGVFSFNVGDFNNDSFTDLIISVLNSDTSYTAIFLNKNGKKFVESSICFELNKISFRYSTISDFDNDGDLDIYGTTQKHNFFLINRLDNNNYIKLKLNGIISSTQALGAKVWVYKNGKLNDKTSLIGYKELGTDAISRNQANDLTLHFGLQKERKCDIKIKFPLGKEIILKDISAGNFLTINEVPSAYSILYRLPGNIYRFLSNAENQKYILLFVLFHLFLLSGLWYEFKFVNWDIKITVIFIILNLSLFWSSLYLSSLSANGFIKFLTPLILTFFSITIPFVLFHWSKKNTNENYYAYNDKLLELVMAFSHGKWALRNLNSIILLCQNSPQNWAKNTDFNSKLNLRFNTFISMTSSSIAEIINYEKLVGNETESLKNLEIATSKTVSIIDKFNKNSIQPELNKLTNNLVSIRRNIKELRSIIYSRFSSYPTLVINNLIDNLENTLTKKSITVNKKKLYPNKIPVLIRAYELANILDNLFQNSITYMNDSEKKLISIEIYKESPKIIIKFSNTGRHIPRENWTTIFQQGYSERNSTGQGLFSAKEILKKYGGRIYISESIKELTTFKIELNEGVILN